LHAEQDIDIDSRFVEFYHKSNEKEEMIILLNNTYENQPTNIISKQPILLKDRQNGKVIGNGTEFNLSLKPAEVMFLMVERK